MHVVAIDCLCLLHLHDHKQIQDSICVCMSVCLCGNRQPSSVHLQLCSIENVLRLSFMHRALSVSLFIVLPLTTYSLS